MARRKNAEIGRKTKTKRKSAEVGQKVKRGMLKVGARNKRNFFANLCRKYKKNEYLCFIIRK